MTFRAAILTAALLLAHHSVKAGVITYTSIYNPAELPATSPSSPGALYWSETASGSSSASVSGGTLSVNTTSAIATTRAWSIGQADATALGDASAWNITPAGGATIDFTLKVTASSGAQVGSPQILGGFNLFFGTGTHVALISFGTTGINLQANANFYNNSHVNTTETTYRLAIQNNLFSLYKEGVATPIFANVGMKASVGNNQFTWGDNQAGVAGAFELSFLGWNNTTAEFSSPVVIPEPGTIGLGLLGCGFLLYAKRRRA